MVEWQTRQLQVLMGATLCRFKSCYPHLFFCLFISIYLKINCRLTNIRLWECRFFKTENSIKGLINL